VSVAALGPVGFLLLMLGVGLRLDSTWQWTGLVLVVLGVVLAATGVAARRRVRPAGTQAIKADRPEGAVEDSACARRSS
jgi:hypothetical protein